MTPTALNALPGSPRASSTPGSAAGFVAEPAGRRADAAAEGGASGGFAAALDEARGPREATEARAPTAPDRASEPSTTVETAAPTAPRPDAEPAASAVAAEAEAAVVPESAAAIPVALPGWPPPGLSSLFPEPVGVAPPVVAPSAALPSSGLNAAAPLAAAGPGAPMVALALADASTAPRAALRLTAPAGVGLSSDAVPLPVDPRGPLAPEPTLPLLSATVAAPLATPAAAHDAIAMALSRQPAPLRMPVLDDRDVALDAVASLGEVVAPERLPDGALPLSTAATLALPKLDLAQAFPAPVPLPSKHFAEDVGARLAWIAEQQGGEATLRIAPEGLGPVEVRMRLDGDRVELGFTATQQDTRQALQEALPKLREMLAQQGLQLGHADVGHRQAPSSNDAQGGRRSGNGDDGEIDAVALAPSSRAAVRVIGRGMLDLYA